MGFAFHCRYSITAGSRLNTQINPFKQCLLGKCQIQPPIKDQTMANQMRETKMHSIYIYASQTINEESQFSAVKGGGKISRYSSRKRLIFSPFSRGIFVNHLSTTSALWSWQILCTYFASLYSVQLDRSFIHSFTNPSIPSTCHCQRVFLSIWSQFHCFLAFCYIFA